jgi:D-alanine-D-alanine ligase
MPTAAVLFGGPSPEHDISISTGLQATRTLGDVIAIYWSKTGGFHLVDPGLEVTDFADGVPRKARELTFDARPGQGWVLKKKPLDISVVVNCCHGGPGEDGTIQGAMDLAGYRYTGPGQAGSALGMDKLAFAASVANAGLPSLPRLLLEPGVIPGFDGPYIVKPRFGGSSIGIEVVDDIDTALALLRTSPHLGDGAVIEPFLSEFRDLNVAVRTHPALTLSNIEEPRKSGDGLYSYEQKYLAWGDAGAPANTVPADVDAGLEAQIREIAPKVAALVGVRSVARIDFLDAAGTLYVNEINTIPGSLSAKLFVDPPVSRRELLDGMIAEALASRPRAFSTHGADGTALRNASTIASKLG